MALSELVGGIAGKIKQFPGLVTRNDDPTLVKDLEERLMKAREARRPYEGQMLLNLSFYFGKQWVIWSQATQQLEKPSVEPWRVMPNINYVRSAILIAYAKIVKDRQAARVQPAGPEADDETAARACDQLLDALWVPTLSEDAMRKAAVWMLICGTGLMKAVWDKSYGPVVGQDPQSGDDLHLGEIQCYPMSPFDFYGEPGCNEISEMEWAFHVTIRPVSYIKKMWGIDVPEGEYDANMTFESQLKTVITGDSSKTRGAVVKEYYERPNKDNPEGRMVIYANEEIIVDGPNPNADPKIQIPILDIRANPRPDSFYGISFIDDMVDPQRIYNKTYGEAIEIQRLTSKPSRLIPIGSIQEGKEITNAPGQEIRYLPVQGLKPELEKGADIPVGYFKLLAETKQAIYETAGQHEVSHGQSPYTRTAAGIAYLQEQDDQRLAPMIRNFDRSFERLEEIKLILARENYQEDRTLSILGKDNKTEVVTFYRDQIPNEVHVHIHAGGQALPRSRVARQDLILKLWTTKPAIIDDPKLILKMLEFGEIEGIYENLNADISQAERENTGLLAFDQQPQQLQPQMDPTTGQPILQLPKLLTPREFHNHPVHMKEHNKIRNSLTYDTAAPIVQEAMDQHVGIHQQMYAQQIMNMQANMGNAATGALGKGMMGNPTSNGQVGERAEGTGLGPLGEPPSPAGQHNNGQPGGMPDGGQ